MLKNWALDNYDNCYYYLNYVFIIIYSRQVISWSSLDWTKQKSTQSRWEWTIILGTLFDVVVHAVNAFVLSHYLSTSEVLLGILLAQVGALLIMYSPRLAWANPHYVPKWIEKRVKPISHENYQSIDN